MRVLIDLECLKNPNSGIANVFKNLLLGIKESKQLLDFSVFGYKTQTEFLKLPVVISQKWHKYVSFFCKSYDIIHVSSQLSSYFHKKNRGQIKIVTLHDLNFLHEKISDRLYKNELRKVSKNIQNADIIVCISEYTKSDFLKNKHLFHFKKEPEIKVIYNGICFLETKSHELEILPDLKGVNYILNIGVLISKKNQKVLIQMLPFIEEHLVLVASESRTEYEEELMLEIQKLGLGSRVHILKNISDADKWSLIANCTAMCHPSKVEGFGIPPIEAMGMGKPVFLSKMTSLPEIGGDVAFYFENFSPEYMAIAYKEGMQTFLKNPEDYMQKLKNRAFIFDYKKMTEQYMKLYYSVLCYKSK